MGVTSLLKIVACLAVLCHTSFALRVSGHWSTDKVYKFLAKFAFQKTAVDEIEGTRGYIFGNVTSLGWIFNESAHIPPATLVIVDGEFITDLYGNASRPVQFFGDVSDNSHKSLWLAETARCRAMLSRINTLAWHRKCQPKAKMDFIRQVPCTREGLCSEEDDKSRVQPDSQFTFTVQDRRQPRYWYLSLIACWRNETTCEWETSALPRPVDLGGPTMTNQESRNTSLLSCNGTIADGPLCVPVKVKYDIWMVNGVPRLRDYYRLEHQFSFEDHDIFEVFIAFAVLYFLLAVIFHIKYKGEYEPLACLLFSHIWLSFLGATLQSIHLATFSFNGLGAPAMRAFGGVVRRAAEALLLVLLLTIADVGFPILPAELSHFEEKVRRYRKRQCQRVQSTMDTASLSSETNNPQATTQSHKLILPAYPATWSAAVSRGRGNDIAKVVAMATVPSTNSLTYKYVVDELPADEVETPCCWGLITCTPRRKRTCVYLGCMMFVIMSMELGLYIWAMCDQDPVLDISVWNTTPGRLLVAARLAVTFWFLFILRQRTSQQLSNLSTVVEPLHFAAAFLLWLLSLPTMVFVAETSISPLWRKKTVIGVMYLFDFLASILFAQLINRSTAYASR